VCVDKSNHNVENLPVGSADIFPIEVHLLAKNDSLAYGIPKSIIKLEKCRRGGGDVKKGAVTRFPLD